MLKMVIVLENDDIAENLNREYLAISLTTLSNNQEYKIPKNFFIKNNLFAFYRKELLNLISIQNK